MIVARASGGKNVSPIPYDVEAMIENPWDPAPLVILCGPSPEGVSLPEVAQFLRMQYQATPIYFITTSRDGFDRKGLIKNGFTDAYLIPMDAVVLEKRIREDLSRNGGAAPVFRPVKLIDITPDVVLEFDTFVYLPMNGKRVRYSGAGDPMDATRVEKLNKHQVAALEVSLEQMPKFYQFAADQLKKIGTSDTISATEKKDRMESAVRELLGGIFTDSSKEGTVDQGRAIVKDCQEIVKAYMVDPAKPGGGWYTKLLSATGSETDTYSHAANVATFASMFAIGTGIGNPEHLAMAGLLHDIGLAEVSVEILNKAESEWTPEEVAIYRKHPEASVNLMKSRKLIVSDLVTRIVVQHHERFDGTGYPRGLSGNKICEEAQLLQLADRFDYLTSASPGQPAPMKPHQAAAWMRENWLSRPMECPVNPDVLRKLLGLFPNPAAAAGTTPGVVV